jgi:hypothetical protein
MQLTPRTLTKRILRGLLALSQALKASDLQLVNVQGLTPVQLDSYSLAACDKSSRGPQQKAVNWSLSC